MFLSVFICVEDTAPVLNTKKKIDRHLSLDVASDGTKNNRKLGMLDMLKSSEKTEQQFKYRDQLYQLEEEMKLYDKDSQDLVSLNTRVDDLRMRISKVLDTVKGKIDFARARLMTLG